MGLTPFITTPSRRAPPMEQAWLKLVRAQMEASLAELLELPDEARFDKRWTRALEQVREYVLRPCQRLRPALLLAGYCLARGTAAVPAGLWRFAAGLELLQAFLTIHDDVVEQTALRHGGLALHHRLAPGRQGMDLAVVMGDHLFARAMETMLGSGLPEGARTCQFYLRVYRHASAGRFLDLKFASPGEVGVLQALRVGRLRAVRQGLCTPLVCGAMLAGADEVLRLRMARVGDLVGRVWCLRGDLWGLFGDSCASDPEVDCDFTRGRCTFPVVAAWSRARAEVRRELEALWALPPARKDDATRERVRQLVVESGGRAATERLMARASGSAGRALAALPNPNGLGTLLRALIGQVAWPNGREERT
jgi:geranylgeranyl diphosphate synthase, type I